MAGVMFHESFLQDSIKDLEAISDEVILGNGVRLTKWRRGVIEVTPASVSEKTKHLVLSSGVHGNETAPIEMLDSIVSDILEQKWQPTCRVLFIIAHFESMAIEKRFVETNLNRLFADKDYPQTKELNIANRLKQDVARFFEGTQQPNRWHLDLHCSIRSSIHYTFAISPQSKFNTRSPELVEFLEKSGIEAVLLSEEASSTFSWLSSSKYGAQAVTLELGQVAKFGQNDMQRLAQFNQTLIELLQDKPYSLQGDLKAYQVATSIYRQNQAFEFFFEASLPNFSPFEQGTELGRDGDELLTMQVSQGAIVFPNPGVEIKQRAALIVKPCQPEFVEGNWRY